MISKILVALSDHSAPILLPAAIDLARQHQARVIALHVVDPSPCFGAAEHYDGGVVFEALEAQGRRTARHIADVLAAAACEAHTHMILLPLSGLTTGGAIGALAEEHGADLILLGARKTRWPWWLREDVAKDVRRATRTPLRFVPDAGAEGGARRPSRTANARKLGGYA
ncbi:universal stress protein [Paraburkholderia acidisoli]|uniref:UspA domain-containing protein n=1 Tax=Paraburkholderia acidisoli TaxID=2571748 RepID=A0A7Z2GP16_9BURK|nr:universal stress protein [Paraburkholderia acidisoli]QGZ65126.1 hypothetical protein FAZ98_25435 [Paraburkholderia acidisoli]